MRRDAGQSSVLRARTHEVRDRAYEDVVVGAVDRPDVAMGWPNEHRTRRITARLT